MLTGCCDRIGSFGTISEFWRYWSNIVVNELPHMSNLRVFQSHIHPSWEDPANAHGGRWVRMAYLFCFCWVGLDYDDLLTREFVLLFVVVVWDRS